MRKYLMLVILLLLIIPSFSYAVEVGNTIELKATKPQGVPLHREPRPSMFERAPDMSRAVVTDMEGDGHWLEILLEDGQTGWIIEKYIGRIVTGSVTAPSSEENSLRVWSSRAECEAVVNTGNRMPKESDKLRVATWNIRFFPDGNMDMSRSDTDLAWLSCAIAWMNADIIALQEIRDTAEAKQAWESVLDGLEAYTGSEWAVDLQDCGALSVQHVGFLWNTDRLTLTDAEDLWQFNGKAGNGDDPCTGSLRPGRYGYVKSAGGLDFHIISVHSDSGTNESDFTHRRAVVERIDSAVTPYLSEDSDVIILGDWNTMGTSSLSAEDEIELMKNSINLVFLKAVPECSEYYRGHAGLLDHIMVSKNMSELETSSATAIGYCSSISCDRLDPDDMPLAYRSLSDHCPLFVDIADIDEDN